VALANPADPVDSSGIFTGKNDWNDQKTFTGRASVLWKPVEKFSAELAFIYANLNGDGGPLNNPNFPGGPYYLDPRITFPSGGNYQAFSAIDQPYWRRTSLASVDISYDAGFATLASTSSYYTTDGETILNGTYGGSAGSLPYYAGNPLNPRFIRPDQFGDTEHTFTEEVRLVSTPSEGKPLDYVVGAFYENQTREGDWNITGPGSYARSVAQGCTGTFVYPGTPPNCLLVYGPPDDETAFVQEDTQSFQDKSIFGELTWHFITNGQITFGGRHFQQDFTDAQSYLDYTFPAFIPATPHSSPASKNLWKINPSYEYAKGQHVYMTWSQGFRRGGANSVPPVGPFRESPLLASYAPDSVNNYEVGLKGRFDNGVTYTVAVFDIYWDKPQISASLPSGDLVVYNANTAQSKGFEIESSGPLFLPGLLYTVGGSYVDAKLTSSYSLPANNGADTGTIVPGLITGQAGEPMPGTPKVSLAATITYDLNISRGYDLATSLNGTYRSSVPLALTTSAGTAKDQSAAFGLANFSMALSHQAWRFTAYVTNILDKQAQIVPASATINLHNIDPALTEASLVNPPREMGIRIRYSF
jgi:hypothetical protein